MPTRNVVITEHQAALIDDLVKKGRYQNASEVLREGLRLIESRDAEQAARLGALREAIQVGEDDFERGDFARFSSRANFRTYLNDLADRAIKGEGDL